MENMHPIDNLFRDKLSKKGNDFQEEHWKLLLRELEGKKRRSILVYWRYAAVISLFAVGGWFLYNTQNNTGSIVQDNTSDALITETVGKPTPTETDVQEEITAIEANSKDLVRADADAKKNFDTEKNLTKNTDGELAFKNVTTTSEIPVDQKSKKKVEAASQLVNVEAVKSTISDEVNTDLNNQSLGNRPVPSGSLAVLSNSKDSSDSAELDGFKNEDRRTASDQDVSVVRTMADKDESITVTQDVDPVPELQGSNESQIEPPTKVPNLDKLIPLDFMFASAQNTSVVPEEPIAFKKLKKGFLSLGPAFMIGRNSIRGSGTSNQTGSNDTSAGSADLSRKEDFLSFDNDFNMTGIELAYHFNEHLDISTGAFYGHKRFNTNGVALAIDQDQSVNNVVEVYNGIVDIPISLGYTFGSKYNTVRPFVRAGVSISAFSGKTKNSVAYDPYIDGVIEVWPEVVSNGPEMDFEDNAPESDDGFVTTAGGASNGPEGPAAAPEEPIEPELVDAQIPSAYGASSFVENGRLFFTNRVKKLLPLYGMAAAGMNIQLSDKLNLFLSGQYKITRKENSGLRTADFQSIEANASRFEVREDGIGSEKGFKNLSGLLSLQYRFN